MQSWKLNEVETPGGSRSPVVLESEEAAARAVLIGLEPGQRLGEHEVKEHAFVLVVDGTVEVEAGSEHTEGSAGTLFLFAPEERHSVTSAEGARLLLFLAPWPGQGHYRGGDHPRATAAR
ncbi:MAG TPA: cupin domain-containing protein [Gaiellaceae bacterium]|nr:cupin domain-containing protein [Gaiellaceae bacterium]